MNTATASPKRLAHYDIIETLKTAGRVHIFRAVDSSTRRETVLKAVRIDFNDSEATGIVAKFREQARVSADLKHPGIVEVYEYGEDGNTAFVASEFVEGCQLRPQLCVRIADAVSLISQLLEALEYAHGLGVVHGGINPSCLLLTSKGKLKITDFGAQEPEPRIPLYLSPEQLRGSPTDLRADLFAAGVLFYEWLTGASPFPSVTEDLVRPVSRMNVGVPQVFDAVCSTSLAKVAQDRYLSARFFGDDVRRAFEDAFVSPPSERVSNETVVSIFLSNFRGASRRKRGGQVRPELQAAPSPSVSASQEQRASSAEKATATSQNVAASPFAEVSKSIAFRSQTESPLRKSVAAELKADPSHLSLPGPGMAAEPALVSRTETLPKLGGKARPVPVPKTSPVATRPQVPSAPTQIAPSGKPETGITARLEEFLGKQPGNLAGYLRQKPARLNEIVHALIAATDALVARYAATTKGGGLTPESICFDRLGKATIRVSTATVPPGSTLDGVVGSPRYAAPEIFSEKSAGADAPIAGADVYALAFMFYEILLGRDLFQKTFAAQKSDLDWLRWHADRQSKAPALKALLPEHPAALSELLESMMAKDAGKRMSDPATVLARLRAVAQQADKTIIVRKPVVRIKAAAKPASGRSSRKNTRRKVCVAITLALAIAGFVTWKNPNLHRKLVDWLHNSVHIYATMPAGESKKPAQ